VLQCFVCLFLGFFTRVYVSFAMCISLFCHILVRNLTIFEMPCDERFVLCYRAPVCCSVLQCVAVCCRVLQCVAVCCSVLQCHLLCVTVYCLCYRAPVCCSELQCVAVCCSVLQCVAVLRSVLQRSAVLCSASHCVAVCCSDKTLLLPSTCHNTVKRAAIYLGTRALYLLKRTLYLLKRALYLLERALHLLNRALYLYLAVTHQNRARIAALSKCPKSP